MSRNHDPEAVALADFCERVGPLHDQLRQLTGKLHRVEDKIDALETNGAPAHIIDAHCIEEYEINTEITRIKSTLDEIATFYRNN